MEFRMDLMLVNSSFHQTPSTTSFVTLNLNKIHRCYSFYKLFRLISKWTGPHFVPWHPTIFLCFLYAKCLIKITSKAPNDQYSIKFRIYLYQKITWNFFLQSITHVSNVKFSSIGSQQHSDYIKWMPQQLLFHFVCRVSTEHVLPFQWNKATE